MASEDDRWFEHNYVYTYGIARHVEVVARRYDKYYSELEGLMMDDGILQFVPHWQKDTALHKFIRYLAEDYIIVRNAAENLVLAGHPLKDRKWTLPVELALVRYGVKDEVDFLLKEIPRVWIKRGNINHSEPSQEVQSACDRHLDELRLTGEIELLLEKLADEVFFIMFTNRAMLQSLHEYLASCVGEVESDWIEAEHPDMTRYFREPGILERSRPPEWARRAVFFRDRGTCVRCHRDLSRLISTFSYENYDHIVPLAKGGLNDVTNLQLLCAECNRKKSDTLEQVSISYERWFA